MTPLALLDHLNGRKGAMLEALEHLVAKESPSADREAVDSCLVAAGDLGSGLLGSPPELVESDGRTHLRWRSSGAARVLLLGHLDTVWPVGTLARRPFTVRDGHATGPGVFDMKAGVVQGLFALAALDDWDGVTLLLTCDEEIGSPSSRRLVEDSAAHTEAVLVLEPSAGGALKTARKGAAFYELVFDGVPAHAGLEPERGASALAELARVVLAVERMAHPWAGTTVTPTLAAAGTASNVVPASARLTIDVRAVTAAEHDRVDEAIRDLRPEVPGVRMTVHGGLNRPPLHPRASTQLFDVAQQEASSLGLGPLAGVSVGGGSDGNFAAGLGVPTLDGLGAVGDGAHAEDEHVVVDRMPERAALVARLVTRALDRAVREH